MPAVSHLAFCSCRSLLRTVNVLPSRSGCLYPCHIAVSGLWLPSIPRTETRLATFATSSRPSTGKSAPPPKQQTRVRNKPISTDPPPSKPNKTKWAPDIKYLEVELPKGDFSKIKKAVFIKSSVTVEDCPKHNLPEFAVIGRSNVGKSSLINCLTGQEKLARVSKDPGLTRCINHFFINDSWYLVDLPGYGYAKQARSSRKEWLAFTKDFFIRRPNLCHVFLLVDASVPIQPADVDCANWLGESEIPFSIVFTKADKAGKDTSKYVNDFKMELMKDWEAIPLCFETSSKAGTGKAQLQQYLAALRKLWVASH